MTKYEPNIGRSQRTAHLLHSYFNTFPTLACFRSNLSAEQRWLSHFSLSKQWHKDLSSHRAFANLSISHQRAMDLIYNESYQFRPGTLIGNLFQTAEPILGKTHRLLLLQPFQHDIKELTSLYHRLSKSSLSPADKIMSFKIGDYLRKLYDESHAAFYQRYLIHSDGVG